MRTIYFFLLLQFGFSASRSQTPFTQLVNKTYAQRREDLKNIYRNEIKYKDSATVSGMIHEMIALAKTKNDKSLLFEAAMMQTYFYYYQRQDNHQLVIDMLDSLRNVAAEENNMVNLARVENMLANFYWEPVNNYELAFEHFYNEYKILKQLQSGEYPDKQLSLYQLAASYYFFSDYTNAISYLREALTIQPGSRLGVMVLQISNTLGLCYQQLNNLDSSDYYFQRVQQLAEEVNDAPWIGISTGNLGYNQFLRSEYDKAIPMLQMDVTLSLKRNDWACASGAMMTLAEIYLKQGNISRASALVAEARTCAYSSGQYNRLKTLYPLMSKLYALKGEGVLANQYLDSAIYVKDSLSRRFSALQLLRAQQKNELQLHRAELQEVEHQKTMKVLQRNILVVLIVLLMLLSIYLYNYQRKKSEQKRLLLNIQLRKVEGELSSATNQLEEFTRRITEKNTQVEVLTQQITNTNTGTLNELQHKAILTDKDWEYFQKLFEQVHGDFLNRLKSKLPGLTPAEIRFIALAKLKLNNKEMAAALGVSTQAIRTTWYRLRKKLSLSEEENVDKLIEMI